MLGQTAQAAKHSRVNFERQSVLLMGALVMAMSLAVHAQSAAPAAEERNSPASQISPQTATGIAPAGTGGKPAAQDIDTAFERADINRDGKLDRREAELFSPVGQRFEALDSNRDNFVSRQELRKMSGS
ncbi:MAG: EF-hand protein [Polaromonas sp.]|jgi:hypothetical protein|nr:EF-hand protein [Polaromonas sp.]